MTGEAKQTPTRVLLADDHTMVREGMAKVLSRQDDIEVIGQAGDGEGAVSLASETRPDVVILDVEMPAIGAREAMRRLRETAPASRVIVVTDFADEAHAQELIRHGACAYLSRSASMQDLIATVRSDTHERSHEEDVTVPRETSAGTTGREADGLLSRRQKEVLKTVARGKSNKQAAEALYLSEATVKRHLASIYAKLGVGSRGEAVRQAVAGGWISARDICGSHE